MHGGNLKLKMHRNCLLKQVIEAKVEGNIKNDGKTRKKI
jgi:hypothetical protein